MMSLTTRINSLMIRNTQVLHLILRHQSVEASPYPVKPERLVEIAKSPSRWAPPADPPPELPFHVKRSRTNNLPVYTDKKAGGSQIITIVRKVTGDVKELEKCLRYKLGNDLHYQVNELTSQVRVKGNHKEPIVQWLKELGF